MPSFPKDLMSPQLDFFLMGDGVVTLFWRERLFDDALSELRGMGYKVVVLDAVDSPDAEAFMVAIGQALDFPDHYGRNLDALNDCLRDVATFDYGSDPDSMGTVVAFRNYDRIVRLAPDRAEAPRSPRVGRRGRQLRATHERSPLFIHGLLVIVSPPQPTDDG